MLKRSIVILLVLGLTIASLALAGCAPKGGAPPTIRIGTLPTEDSLPLYVAVADGLAKQAGIQVEMVTFPSAQERDAALVAGKIDGFMGDPLAAAELTAKATPVKIVTVMLGADPSEGRFGIAVPPGSPVKTAIQLSNAPVAVSSNTITEYVVDSLLRAEGLADAQIKKVEIKKIPVRMQLLLAGKIKAAGLPDPLLALVASKGARVLIDDTQGQNLSQTVLVFRTDYLEGHADAVKRLLAADAAAVKAVNADPEKYRALLVDKAKLPPDIAKTYKLNVYPEPQLPRAVDIQRVLTWMEQRNLIPPGSVTYAKLVATDLGVK